MLRPRFSNLESFSVSVKCVPSRQSFQRRQPHSNLVSNQRSGRRQVVMQSEAGKNEPLLDGTEAGEQTNEDPKNSDRIDWSITLPAFLFPSLGGTLFGYDIGASSGLLTSIQNKALSTATWAYDLTTVQEGLVVSLSVTGALVSSVLAFFLGSKLGRRGELLLASVLYIVAASCIAGCMSLGQLYAAKMVYGLGIGFAMHAAPAYIAETAPSSVRGALISFKEALIVGGILLGYSMGAAFVSQPDGWRAMYGLAAPLGAVLLMGMLWLPDTPRWLELAGKPGEVVENSLRRLKGSAGQVPGVVEAELQAIRETSDEAKAAESGNPLALLSQKRYLKPLSIGVLLILFQQITGQPSVLYYANQIFAAAGFSDVNEAARVSVGLGVFKLLATLVAVFTVDAWGRRPLLLLGVSTLTATLFVLAISQGAAPIVSLVALLLYVGAYQVSFGPIAWLLVGELFPLAIRSSAIAVATFTNFGSNSLVAFVLPTMRDALGTQATYGLFGAIGIAAVAYIATQVPETRGKSLEEIERMFNDE